MSRPYDAESRQNYSAVVDRLYVLLKLVHGPVPFVEIRLGFSRKTGLRLVLDML